MIQRIRSIRSCTHFGRENGRKASDGEKGESDFYFIVVGSLSMMTRSTWINKATTIAMDQTRFVGEHRHTQVQSTHDSNTREWITIRAMATHPHQKWFAPWSKKGYLVWPDERKCQTTIHLFDNWFFAIDRTHIQNSDQSSIGLRDSHDRKDMRMAKCECLCFATHQRTSLALSRWSNLTEWPGAWPKRITGCVDGDTKWRRLRMRDDGINETK